MRSKRVLAFVPALAIALGACASSATPPAPTQVAVATLTPTAVPLASTAPSDAPSTLPAPSVDLGGPSPTPGSIDPCSLLTKDEASTAIGKTVGAGVSATLDPDRVCTFKNGLTEVKLILAPPAPDAKTAQAYWDAERGQVPAGVNVTDVAGFDRAAYGSGSLNGLSISALFVIHGTTFFDFYCGLPACSKDASVTAANAIVARLP
jgi:hypothetical protein